MSRKKRDLTEDEKALWRRVARSVKPRRAPPPEVGEVVAKRPEGVARNSQKAAPPPSSRASRATPPPQAGEAKRPPPKLAPPADRGAEKRVRRGKLEIDAKLDLNGYTQDGAYAALATFLSGAQRRNARVALVVTGVGRTGEGVLRKRLPDWLAAKELKPIISGYAQAHRAHGGTGAFYVFLKRKD